MQSDLVLENLQLRKTLLETQSRLMNLEHKDIVRQIQEIENARPVSGGDVLSET